MAHRIAILVFVVLGILVVIAPHASAGQPSPVRVGADAATVRAKLARDDARRVTYRFEWRAIGKTWRRAASRRGAPGRIVSERLTGLRPAKRYAYRLVMRGRPTRTRSFRTRPLVKSSAPPTRRTAAAVPTRTPPASSGTTAEPERDPEPSLLGSPPTAFLNPVSFRDSADPMVLRDGQTYWSYTTGDRFPIMRSTDLVNWEPAGQALPSRPSWATSDADWHPWAPSVLRRQAPCPGQASGPCFVMYFVALSSIAGPLTNCIGVATSPTPDGPFADRGVLKNAPGDLIGCGDDRGFGNIDPAPFVDEDGSVYLYVSTDTSCAAGRCTLAPTISVLPLGPDALGASGARRPLFSGRRGTWEQAPWAPVVENPWVVRRGDTLHLLYSGGPWSGAYAMGHAAGPSPLGPFTRSTAGPILSGTAEVDGPGGGMPVEGPHGGDWMVYHGRATGVNPSRMLRIDPLSWIGDGAPSIDGPSTARVLTLP